MSGEQNWIARAADICEAAARGDLEQRAVFAPVDGEMGRLLHAINAMLDMTDAFVRESGASLEHAAQGKFFRRVLPRGMHGCFERGATIINRATEQMAVQARALKQSEERRAAMGAELAEAIETLASSATEMRVTAETLATASNEAADQTVAATAASQRTSANVTQVSESATQLRAESAEVDRTTRECLELANEASREATDAGPVVENLGAVSRRVSGVVKMVSEIARQTNLLALNASIEAARAGEAGRGFAVVAAEVKDLARTTATATEEIGTEITQMEAAATRVSATLDSICKRIQGVDRLSGVIAQSVERQLSSAVSIANNVHEAVEATQAAGASMRLVSQAVDQTDTCAAQLLAAADELSRQSERLQADSAKYLQH